MTESAVNSEIIVNTINTIDSVNTINAIDAIDTIDNVDSVDTMNNPLIELDDVCYAYDGHIALRHISLAINRGKTVAIQGTNGCGKSTLLKLLNGLIFPEKGHYYFNGTEITAQYLKDNRSSRNFHQRIGFIFQSADVQLFCNNVRDEIAFAPLQMGLDEAEAARRTDDVIRLLGIEHLADRAPYQLSGGEKRKVAFGSILTMNPDVYVFDEPLAGLDKRSQDWFEDFLQQLQAAGKTIILSTHDDALAHLLGDRIIYMSENHSIDYVL